MAKMIQNNFSGGVLSPLLMGRSDLAVYYKGCATADNFLVTKEGTLRKRRGVESFATLSDLENTKIAPYQYDRTNGGFVVMVASGTTLTCDYYRKGDTAAHSSCSVANFAGEVDAIQVKQIGDQLWLSNGDWYKVLTITDNDTISASDWTPAEQPEGVTSITSVGYNSSDQEVSPSGKTLTYAAYMVKDGVLSAPKTVAQKWYSSWTAGYYVKITITVSTDSDFDYLLLGKKTGGTFGEIGRWYPEDIENNSIEFKDDNITAGEGIYAQTNVLGDGFTHPLCIDCFQQRRAFANGKAYESISVTLSDAAESYTADDGIQELLSVTYDGVDRTDECTVEGSTITFPESQTWKIKYLNTNLISYPMTLWFSEVGNLNNFYADRPSADDDPFSQTISSTGPSFIRWIIAYQEMLVLFTDAGLFSVGFSQQSGFSASSSRISRFSNLSISETIAPVTTDAGIVFVGADNKTVYTISYDLQENMLKPINRSVLVEHLTRSAAIKSIALQSYPGNVIWFTLDDGTYATFTFEKNEEVYAWSRGEITDATIEDIISLGTVTDNSDDRTYSDLLFVVTKDDTTYLCTQEDVYADTIGSTTTNVCATLTTLYPESKEATLVATNKNIHDIVIRLFETGGISVVPTSGGNDITLVAADITGTFTGDVKVMPRGVVDEHGQMTFVSDNASACEILLILMKVEAFQ